MQDLKLRVKPVARAGQKVRAWSLFREAAYEGSGIDVRIF